MTSVYNAAEKWSEYFAAARDVLPAQGLVRVMKGNYPNLPSLPKSGAAIDIGCGDGRNSRFLSSLGFSTVGLEISEEIVLGLRSQPKSREEFVVGNSAEIPFQDSTFDLLVGWNSIYYMGSSGLQIADHFKEFRRVLKSDGTAIFSIPQPTSFIYRNLEKVRPDCGLEGVDYVLVTSDPFGLRVGETLARFSDLDALKSAITSSFDDVEVSIGEEMGNWFGLQYDWWVVIVAPTASKS